MLNFLSSDLPSMKQCLFVVVVVFLLIWNISLGVLAFISYDYCYIHCQQVLTTSKILPAAKIFHNITNYFKTEKETWSVESGLLSLQK